MTVVGATKVKRPVSVAVRPPDVTATSIVPADGLAAVTAMRVVELWMVTELGARPTRVTAASLAKPVPVIVTVVPPVVLPADGEMLVTLTADDGSVAPGEHEAHQTRPTSNRQLGRSRITLRGKS